MKKAKTKCEPNCEVLQTDNHEHVSQVTPRETDKKAIAEYTEWEKRPGKATR